MVSEQPTDEPLVESEPLDPAETGVGETGTSTVPAAAGSDSTGQAAPDEAGTYIARAQEALMTAFGTLPSMLTIDPALMARMTVLVLVKGDRCTPRDVHDSWAVWRHEEQPDDPTIVPWDLLDPKEQQGLDGLTAAIQRAGRFMGRDGS